MASSFLVFYVITNEKTLKLTQIDRLLAASKINPAETCSNNSGRYTCCYIYLGCTYRLAWCMYSAPVQKKG